MEIVLLAVFAFVFGCILTAVVLVPRFDKDSMERSYQQSAAVLARSSFRYDGGGQRIGRPIEGSTVTFFDPEQFKVTRVTLDDK